MQEHILAQTKNMSRQEWLKLRQKGLGGSDAAAIIGLNAFVSPFDVYALKLGLKEESEDNEAMRQGRDLEDYVAARFTEKTGKKVRRRHAMLQHPQNSWMLANIDRLVIGEEAGLECKTTSVLNKSKFKQGEYPDSYYAQCVHYLAVTGLKKWYLAVLVLNKGFHVFEILRDESEIDALIAAEKIFWEEHIQKEIPPCFDGSSAASNCLKAMYPAASPGETKNLYGLESTIAAYLRLEEKIKAFEKEQELAKQIIQAALQTAETGKAQGYLVEWKNRQRSNFDQSRFQKEHTELFLTYQKDPTNYRVFNIKEVK